MGVWRAAGARGGHAVSVARAQGTASLIEVAQQGLGASFDALAEQHRRALYTAAYRWFEEHETALDCVQETLLRAFQSLHRFRGECAFSTWLFRILENVCLEEQRRLARWVRNAQVADLAHDLGMEERVAAREEAVTALQALAQLPLNLRTASLLSLVEGHSHAETSAILGLTTEAVRARVSRARALMASAPSPPAQAAVGAALSEGYQLIGSLLLRQGNLAESDQALLSSISYSPGSAYNIWGEYWDLRGLPLHREREAQALRVLTRAAEGPHPAVARVALANLYNWVWPDLPLAERYYRAHLHDAEIGEKATLHLAYLYAYTPNQRRALPLLYRLLREYSGNSYAVVLLARSLAASRDAAALHWARRAEAVAMSGYHYRAPHDQRSYQLQTANLRSLASDTFLLLGDRASARRLALAARDVIPKEAIEGLLAHLLGQLAR
jgi:RNA polymerase sigma-70 factor (ECF subfamily)